MVDRIIKPIEVKRHFLLAEDFRSVFDNPNPSSDELSRGYEELVDDIWDYDEDALNQRIIDKVRLARYDNSDWDWHSGNVRLEDMGCWPKMKGFPISYTTGNIVETARRVSESQDNEKTPKVKRFLEKHKSVRKWKDFIFEKFPLILFPGGEVRENDYNRWARDNGQPECEIFAYDIDDGSSRALSYSLMEINEAPCFYGVER